ncbi:MAG: hypothetical protein ACI86H_002375 [bacterium]|jgi:hypothetical protein
MAKETIDLNSQKVIEIEQGKISKLLDWAYEKAINGIPGFDSAQKVASDYSKEDGELIDQVNSLIRWQNTKAGTSGFISGLGGAITLPVAVPANVASVMYIQMRMIASIASMAGYDLHDDKVKTLTFACLTGNAAKDLLKEVGIQIGVNVTKQVIQNISQATITAINRKVGFLLVTKFGEKGVINLGKAVPIVGGIIGGGIDLISTNTIGNIARDTFLGGDHEVLITHEKQVPKEDDIIDIDYVEVLPLEDKTESNSLKQKEKEK